MSVSSFEYAEPAEWMASEEACGRGLDDEILDHDHLITRYASGDLDSVDCLTRAPLPPGFMDAVDDLRGLLFSHRGVSTKVFNCGTAALTASLCSDWDIGWSNPGFDNPSTFREDGKPFQAVSVAYNAHVETMNDDTALLQVIDRYCWGTIETSKETYVFDPDVNRATLLVLSLGKHSLAEFSVRPAQGILTDMRSVSNKYALGSVLNTQNLDRPADVILNIMERALERPPLTTSDKLV